MLNVTIQLTDDQVAEIRAMGDAAVRAERDAMLAWFGEDWLRAGDVEEGLIGVGSLDVFVDDMLGAIGAGQNGDVLESYDSLLVRVADLVATTINELAARLTPEQLADYNDDHGRAIDYPGELARQLREQRAPRLMRADEKPA